MAGGTELRASVEFFWKKHHLLEYPYSSCRAIVLLELLKHPVRRSAYTSLGAFYKSSCYLRSIACIKVTYKELCIAEWERAFKVLASLYFYSTALLPIAALIGTYYHALQGVVVVLIFLIYIIRRRRSYIKVL